MSSNIMSKKGGSGGRYEKTLILSAAAPFMELDISDIPANKNFLDILIATDVNQADGISYNLKTNNVDGLTVEGVNPKGWIGTRHTVVENWALGGIGSLENDQGMFLGNMPNDAISYNFFEVTCPPVTGFPPGTTSSIELVDNIESFMFCTWDPAQGINLIFETPLATPVLGDGRPIAIVVRIRDINGNPAYPYDFSGNTQPLSVYAYLPTQFPAPGITDHPWLHDLTPDLINVHFSFKDIFINNSCAGVVNLTHEKVFLTEGGSYIAGTAPFYTNNDQATVPIPAIAPPLYSNPRAIRYGHTSRINSIYFAKCFGELMAGSRITVLA